MYHSIIIEESLKNPGVLENYKILRTKFAPKENWHLHIVEIPEPLEKAIKDIQQVMVSDEPFYFHAYDEGKTLIVAFKDRVFHLDPDDESTWQEAREYGGKKLGIPPEQLDFCPRRISEEDAWYK